MVKIKNSAIRMCRVKNEQIGVINVEDYEIISSNYWKPKNQKRKTIKNSRYSPSPIKRRKLFIN
jgi:hypothetical protein